MRYSLRLLIGFFAIVSIAICAIDQNSRGRVEVEFDRVFHRAVIHPEMGDFYIRYFVVDPETNKKLEIFAAANFGFDHLLEEEIPRDDMYRIEPRTVELRFRRWNWFSKEKETWLSAMKKRYELLKIYPMRE